MKGNKRIAGDRNQYISYRYGCRVSKDGCSNSEIKRETLEKFVLTELEKRLFTEEAISKIVKEVNAKLKSKTNNSDQELHILEKKLQQTEKEIQNIVDAIMKGLVSSTLSEKLTQLEGVKNNLLIEVTKLKTANEEGTGTVVTKEQIRKMTKEFKKLILEKEFSQCSPFVRDFVKQVTVFKDRVEVEFNMVFLLSKSSIIYKDGTIIERNYKSFTINVN